MTFVGFRETVYEVTEGNDVTVCVEVRNSPGGCTVNFPFDISFETIDNSSGN